MAALGEPAAGPCASASMTTDRVPTTSWFPQPAPVCDCAKCYRSFVDVSYLLVFWPCIIGNTDFIGQPRFHDCSRVVWSECTMHIAGGKQCTHISTTNILMVPFLSQVCGSCNNEIGDDFVYSCHTCLALCGDCASAHKRQKIYRSHALFVRWNSELEISMGLWCDPSPMKLPIWNLTLFV